MNNKKKFIYLSVIIGLLIASVLLLFLQKQTLLRTYFVANELQKELLAYIEKEEVYPDTLKEIKTNFKSLNVTYIKLENGRACRFTVEGKVFELWDEKR